MRWDTRKPFSQCLRFNHLLFVKRHTGSLTGLNNILSAIL